MSENLRKATLKSRLGGIKKALTPQQVKDIKHILKNLGKTRDYAMFSVHIDSLLRCCDFLRLRYEDLIDTETGKVLEEVRLRQRKTKFYVNFVLSPATQKALMAWVKKGDKKKGDYLWTGIKRYPGRHILRPHYSSTIKMWVAWVGVKDVDCYSTHSIRRSKAAYVYEETKDVVACMHMLGHSSLAHTARYLGVDTAKAMSVSRKYRM